MAQWSHSSAEALAVPPSDFDFAARLIEQLVVATFVLSPTGEVLVWNGACERPTGLAAASVVGTREHWRALYERPRPCLADIILNGRSATMDALY